MKIRRVGAELFRADGQTDAILGTRRKTWTFQDPQKKVHCAKYLYTILDRITYSLTYLLNFLLI